MAVALTGMDKKRNKKSLHFIILQECVDFYRLKIKTVLKAQLHRKPSRQQHHQFLLPKTTFFE
jgi:hypothetical protein